MDIGDLNEYRDILIEIDTLEAEKQRIIDRLLAPKVLDGMPHSNKVSDPVADAAVKLADIQRIIDKRLDTIIDLRLKIERAINRLHSRERTILTLYYLNGYSLEKTAEKMGLSYQWVCELRNRALLLLLSNYS